MRRLGAHVLAACVWWTGAPAAAGGCRLLRYTFEVAARPGTGLDLPPQIAVWLQGADGTYVDTMMVTSAVALEGIGNRPGRADLPSGPRFPYGRRPMALPVWAQARGHLYPEIVMEDGDEADLMGHEATSSPEPYFCRPMLPSEVVDAITCPSGQFRSAKGVFAPDGRMSFYPPRADLLSLLAQPCPYLPNRPRGGCEPGDSPRFALLDDVDAIATATPPPGVPYTGLWAVPSALPDGDYAVMVEVAKEFDDNASYAFASSEGPLDAMYPMTYGLYGNLGQPSAVYQVPISLTVGAAGVATAAAGHGDPLGAVGTLFQPDGTLSTASGSGEGRLAIIDGPEGAGRIHVAIEACPALACDPAAPPRTVEADVLPADVTPTSAVLEIRQDDADAADPVLGYEVRYRPVAQYESADPGAVDSWTPGPTLPPAAAGALSQAVLQGLAPDSGYVVAVWAKGACGDSAPTLVRFATPPFRYQRLSGCFVVSAAFDDGTVEVLRRERDGLVRQSGLAAAAADIYRGSAPPLAGLLRGSSTARALARRLLAVPVTVARAVGERFSGR